MPGLLRRRLAGAAPRLLDGAAGTGLGTRLGDRRGGPERLNLEDPDAVTALHLESLAAGAGILRTNTFCASGEELRSLGLSHRAEDIARAGAELARAAGRKVDAAPLCLGVIGPGAGVGEGSGVAGADSGRIRGLLAGGVDGILVETLPGVSAARRIVRAIRTESALVPVLISFSPLEDGQLTGGGSALDIARAAHELEVDLVGLNCSFGPNPMDGPLAAIREAWDGPLGAWPNAGLPCQKQGHWEWPISPETLAAWCASATRAHDLKIVGGCCGTSAAHVAAVSKALAQSGGVSDP